MGLIREPKNVDFYVVDKPWTADEKKEFSELIRKLKSKSKSRKLNTRHNVKAKAA